MGKASGLSLYTTVDDELYDEVSELVGETVVYVEVWEDSLVDALEGESEPPASEHFDIDLYLKGGVYFELYGVQCFSSLDGDPWTDVEQVQQRLIALVKSGIQIEEIAVDEAEGLVLVLGHEGTPQLYLDIGGWLIDDWDELPEA
jgi:hypothetical protein